MAKKKNVISKKDRKHLIEFDRQHPADIESNRFGVLEKILRVLVEIEKL